MLTLIATTGGAATRETGNLSTGCAARPVRGSDADALGRLYFAAYEAGVAGGTLEEAVADIGASFAGAYGEFWHAGSLLIERRAEVVAAVLAVRRAPWEDTPDCPFVIELFTDRRFRRRGLARYLMGRCLIVARAEGAPAVALRVDEGNAGARALYASLGFRSWEDEG